MKKYWKYVVLSRTGQEINGCMEGDLNVVKDKLVHWQGQILSIHFDYARLFMRLKYSKPIAPGALADLFLDMANMLEAGLTITAMIVSVRQSNYGQRIIHIFNILEADIAEGMSLAESIGRVKELPWTVSAAICAGEKTGSLREVLLLLAENFRFKAQMNGRLSEAVFYPSVIFCSLLFLCVFLSFNIVPKLSALLPPETFNKGGTHVLIEIIAFLTEYWIFIVGGLLTASLLLMDFFKKRQTALGELIYGLPVIGDLCKAYYLAFYFKHLHLLLRSGVCLMDALNDLYVRSPGNLSQRFLNCREYMLGGVSFGESLRMDAFFPPMISLSITKAEETAKLEVYCGHLGEYYQKSFQQGLNKCVGFLQPLLLCVAGFFLMLIAGCFLMPIYSNLTKIAGH